MKYLLKDFTIQIKHFSSKGKLLSEDKNIKRSGYKQNFNDWLLEKLQESEGSRVEIIIDEKVITRKMLDAEETAYRNEIERGRQRQIDDLTRYEKRLKF